MKKDTQDFRDFILLSALIYLDDDIYWLSITGILNGQSYSEQRHFEDFYQAHRKSRSDCK